MTPTSEDLADFFRVRGIEFGRCLEPTLQCREEAINAHSIQNRRTIELLQRDNHVLVWQPRFTREGPEVALREVGRNEASTFRGFCNRHDTELFIPLDTKPFEPRNDEQLFLLAYRGITCELHSIMTGVLQLQTLYNTHVARGVDAADASSPVGQKSLEQMILSWATWRYRNKHYDEPLLKQSQSDIEHKVIELEDQPACIAASSFITTADGPLTADLVGVAINVIPVSHVKTVVVFSFAKQDRGTVCSALDRIIGSQGYFQKYELSKLILGRISNVVLSPAHVDGWGAERTGKIRDAFMRSAQIGQDVGDDKDLMLF